jgi:HEPN domain-containing protein
MPHDPEFVAETRSWLVKAAADIRLAEIVQREDASLRGDPLVHCQQSAVQSLKAFLTWNGQTFRKTHSIGELGQAVVEIAADLQPLPRSAVRLTDYGWKFRYPVDVDEPLPEELTSALEEARGVHAAVLATLLLDVRP